MSRRKREVSIADELVDELLKDYRKPADLLRESGLIRNEVLHRIYKLVTSSFRLGIGQILRRGLNQV
jgi:hypothetical protein